MSSKENLETQVREWITVHDTQIASNRVLKKLTKKILEEATAIRPSSHTASYEKVKESTLASILFMDIVGYSRLRRDDDQKQAILYLNQLVLEALSITGCLIDDIVCLPTGDGMCLCFLAPTDGPLLIAEEVQTALRNKIQKSVKPIIKIRMGIHCGNVLRVKDLKGDYNLSGAAINIAQRAMNCGDAGHILCTVEARRELVKMKDYAHVLKRIKEPFTVKHDKRLALYNYTRKGRCGNEEPPSSL